MVTDTNSFVHDNMYSDHEFQEMSEYLLLVNTSGITLAILGIVKEVITLLLAHHLHGDRLTSINLVGLSLCVAGMVVHSVSKHSRKKVPTRMTSSALNPLIAVEHEDRKMLLVRPILPNS